MNKKREIAENNLGRNHRPKGMKKMDKKAEVKKPTPKSSTYKPESERFPGNKQNSVPGINSPEISLPAFNPPVPNRAWTAMRKGMDIDELSAEEKRDMYLGRDNIF